MEMQETKDKAEDQQTADSQYYGKYKWRNSEFHHHFWLLRLLFGIVILVVVFCLGVMVGQFHHGVSSRHGRFYRGGIPYRYSMPMFNGRGYYPPGNTGPLSPTNTQSSPGQPAGSPTQK